MGLDLTDEQIALIQDALSEYEYMNRATGLLPAIKWMPPATRKRFKKIAKQSRELRLQLEKHLTP